jgi:hypothetical protein
MALVVIQISGYLAKSWLVPCGLKLRKPGVARGGLPSLPLWHFWQDFSRFFSCIFDFGSVDGWMAWLPWQSKHLAVYA